MGSALAFQLHACSYLSSFRAFTSEREKQRERHNKRKIKDTVILEQISEKADNCPRQLLVLPILETRNGIHSHLLDL